MILVIVVGSLLYVWLWLWCLLYLFVVLVVFGLCLVVCYFYGWFTLRFDVLVFMWFRFSLCWLLRGVVCFEFGT